MQVKKEEASNNKKANRQQNFHKW